MKLLSIVGLLWIGLAGGIAVGAGLVAFITVLGIVPRLCQLSKTGRFIRYYEYAIITGSVFWTWCGLRESSFLLNKGATVLFGACAGVFVGLLAAALTEVLNVLPILAKRMYMVDQILWLVMSIVLGKVFGSLFHWIWFAPYP